jgi:hypothetical protein
VADAAHCAPGELETQRLAGYREEQRALELARTAEAAQIERANRLAQAVDALKQRTDACIERSRAEADPRCAALVMGDPSLCPKTGGESVASCPGFAALGRALRKGAPEGCAEIADPALAVLCEGTLTRNWRCSALSDDSRAVCEWLEAGRDVLECPQNAQPGHDVCQKARAFKALAGRSAPMCRLLGQELARRDCLAFASGSVDDCKGGARSIDACREALVAWEVASGGAKPQLQLSLVNLHDAPATCEAELRVQAPTVRVGAPFALRVAKGVQEVLLDAPAGVALDSSARDAVGVRCRWEP